MMWQMSLVVVASLLFSLVEAFLILPSHLAHSKGLQHGQKVYPVRKKIEDSINKVTNNVYGPVLRLALAHKWIVCGFTDLTNTKIQTEIWQREDNIKEV